MSTPNSSKLQGAGYDRLLYSVAGLGGLLYGVDIGIIGAALIYMGQAIQLTPSQQSILVATVFGGSMVSSLVAGFLAGWLGRKKMIVASGALYVVSVAVIISSYGFAHLFAGRLLLGISAGLIVVVVPLYLAECLPATSRGRGTSIFQFLLTLGIALGAFIGLFYTGHAEAAIKAANGSEALIRDAANAAWHHMYLCVMVPAVLFSLGCLFLGESPRWLFQRGRKAEALDELRRNASEDMAQTQLREMEELAAGSTSADGKKAGGSLLQRRYVIPFVLACIVLACNQASGINSILSYLVIILKQAGMSAARAGQGDVAVKLLNCLMTIVAVALVERKGRKFLLTMGTGGMIVALFAAGFVYHGFESKRVDVRAELASRIAGGALTTPLGEMGGPGSAATPMALSVVYNDGSKDDKMKSVLSTDADATLRLKAAEGGALTLKNAYYGPVPSERTGWLVTGFVALFIASFAVGPGVVAWLALSELMPTRIRSAGMGIALLLNQGISMALAGVFLPTVGHYGYYAMFWFWGACTIVYFVTATFFLPETKGKTLEEIEAGF
jgi:MFS family permease